MNEMEMYDSCLGKSLALLIWGFPENLKWLSIVDITKEEHHIISGAGHAGSV